MDLRRALRQARDASGLSYRELSQKTGYTEAHLSRVFAGKSGMTFLLVKKLSKAMGSSRVLVVYWLGEVSRLKAALSRAKDALRDARAAS